ncbi:MAG: Gfo/Idh/MocA family oxidoreductase [Chitinophagaceae bacterium]
MHKPFRWGILGAGNIAEKFASALNYTENAEIYAVASRDADKAKKLADKYGASHAYGHYNQLAEDPSVDIIYIATPHAFHCEQAIMCLQHKKAVLCEKPMALSLEQVRRMVNAAKKNSTFLMEGMWSAFMPSITKMQELIAQDAIGPVQFIRADFGFQAPTDATNRLYNLELGGGSLLDVGIYPLFLTTLLLGEPSRIQSMATLAETGADACCSMQFQYPGGEFANIFSSITFKSSLTAEITGTKGRILLHRPFYKATSISLEPDEGEVQQFSLPHEHNGFEYEIREVMQCLEKGLVECPLMPFENSLVMAGVMDTVRAQCGVVY